MMMLLRPSHNAVVLFLWAKGLNADGIHSEMCPVYGDRCLMRPAIHVRDMQFACSRESIVDKDRSGTPGAIVPSLG